MRGSGGAATCDAGGSRALGEVGGDYNIAELSNENISHRAIGESVPQGCLLVTALKV